MRSQQIFQQAERFTVPANTMQCYGVKVVDAGGPWCCTRQRLHQRNCLLALCFCAPTEQRKQDCVQHKFTGRQKLESCCSHPQGPAHLPHLREPDSKRTQTQNYVLRELCQRLCIHCITQNQVGHQELQRASQRSTLSDVAPSRADFAVPKARTRKL